MRKIMVFTLLSIMMLFGTVMQGNQVGAEAGQAYGDIAHQHLTHLATNIGERLAGTDGERESRDYILDSFERLGLNTEVQPFSYTTRNNTVNSSNVIGVQPGNTDQEIIIGAHYDTVRNVEGVEDNASGVAVMLEIAERIKDMDLAYTIRFIAFGAEEAGLKGSNYYVSQMSQSEIDKTKVMINLDSLIVGDYMYVYGEVGAKGWVRELGLRIGRDLGIDLRTSPGLNPRYPKGTTIDASDHAAFRRAGITYGYLEGTNWEIGALDGYTQTEKHGGIWHDPGKDNMAFIQAEFPERFDTRLAQFSQILHEWVLQLMPNIDNMKAQVELAKENGDLANEGVARLLHVHLTSINHYQNTGSMDKAIKHIVGFNSLIEQMEGNGLMSQKAYHSFKADADQLIVKWEQ